MIYGNINNKRNSSIYHPIITKALEALKQMDTTTENGIYELSGDDMFIRLLSLNTKTMADCFPEIHEKHVDLHYLISGKERIYFSLQIPEHIVKNNIEDDHVFFDAFIQKAYIDMNEGDFLVCFPEDLHLAAIAIEEPIPIKKAIVKIGLSLFNN